MRAPGRQLIRPATIVLALCVVDTTAIAPLTQSVKDSES
jgi:hypothetical protein